MRCVLFMCRSRSSQTAHHVQKKRITRFVQWTNQVSLLVCVTGFEPMATSCGAQNRLSLRFAVSATNLLMKSFAILTMKSKTSFGWNIFLAENMKWNSPLTFAKQIFHSEAISYYEVIFHSPQGEFHWKKTKSIDLVFFLVEQRSVCASQCSSDFRLVEQCLKSANIAPSRPFHR